MMVAACGSLREKSVSWCETPTDCTVRTACHAVCATSYLYTSSSSFASLRSVPQKVTRGHITMTAVSMRFSALITLFLLIDTASSWSQSLSTRRGLFQGACNAVLAAAGVCSVSSTTLLSHPAFAATVPSQQELGRLQKGHARVTYLLEHWDDVTKVCGTTVMSDTERKQVIRTEGGGGTDTCSKTPLRVQEFMGYKSTEDPLYRVDKLMVRATPLVDPDDLDAYLEVVERYREKADMTAMMAYTSSWGEANPNGGKEVIDAYLERTKLDVIESEKLLRSVLCYLRLSPLPASQGTV